MRTVSMMLGVVTIAAAAGALRADEAKPKTDPKPTEPIAIFHVGNSLTDQAYGMHDIAQARGHATKFGRHMIPGAPLDWLWNHRDEGFREPDKDTPADQILSRNKWDVLILQPFGRDASVSIEHGAKYMHAAFDGNPKCRVYLFAHYPAIGDKQEDAAKWEELYLDPENKRGRATFEAVAQGLSDAFLFKPDVRIIPLGEVMLALNKKMKAGDVPGFKHVSELYEDATHLNAAGKYVEAVTHYAVVFEDDPDGVITKGLRFWKAPYEVDEKFAQVVWDVAWETVLNYPPAMVWPKATEPGLPGEELPQVAIAGDGRRNGGPRGVPGVEPVNPVTPGPDAPPPGGDGPADAAPTMIFRMHAMHDPLSANMASHTVLYPKGWQVAGGAWWAAKGFFNIMPSQDVRVMAPDGRLVHVGPSIVAVDYYPSEQAQQNGATRPQEGKADAGLPIVHMPQGINEWVQYLGNKSIPQNEPEARDIELVDAAIVPELTQIYQQALMPIHQQMQTDNAKWAQMGVYQRSYIDGGVIAAKFRYTLGGRPFEHLFVLTTFYRATESQRGVNLRWGLDATFSFRAPAGELEANMPLFIAIANSVKTTPQWARMKADHMAKMNQIALQGAANVAAIWNDANRQISDMIHSGYREREKIRDASQTQLTNAILEVNDYSVPGSGEVTQLPNQYEHVYTNGIGDYILTNDHFYNPNTDPNVNNQSWETMKPVQR